MSGHGPYGGIPTPQGQPSFPPHGQPPAPPQPQFPLPFPPQRPPQPWLQQQPQRPQRPLTATVFLSITGIGALMTLYFILRPWVQAQSTYDFATTDALHPFPECELGCAPAGTSLWGVALSAAAAASALNCLIWLLTQSRTAAVTASWTTPLMLLLAITDAVVLDHNAAQRLDPSDSIGYSVTPAGGAILAIITCLGISILAVIGALYALRPQLTHVPMPPPPPPPWTTPQTNPYA